MLMKKKIAILFIVIMGVFMTACGNTKTEEQPAQTAEGSGGAAQESSGTKEEKIVVGFANIAETAYQHTAIKESMEEEG